MFFANFLLLLATWHCFLFFVCCTSATFFTLGSAFPYFPHLILVSIWICISTCIFTSATFFTNPYCQSKNLFSHILIGLSLCLITFPHCAFFHCWFCVFFFCLFFQNRKITFHPFRLFSTEPIFDLSLSWHTTWSHNPRKGSGWSRKWRTSLMPWIACKDLFSISLSELIFLEYCKRWCRRFCIVWKTLFWASTFTFLKHIFKWKS